MAIVGFLLAPGFDDVEFRVLCSRLREAGHRTIIISRARGELLVSRKMSKLILVDGGLDHYAPTAFSALVILGGKDPGYLQTRFDTSSFIRHFAETKRPIVALTAGVSLLIDAGVIRGRRVACCSSLRESVEQARGEWVDAEVAVDGALLTTGSAEHLELLCEKLLARLPAYSDKRRRHNA
jgi:protease I